MLILDACRYTNLCDSDRGVIEGAQLEDTIKALTIADEEQVTEEDLRFIKLFCAALSLLQ